jgi:hypothetical protein
MVLGDPSLSYQDEHHGKDEESGQDMEAMQPGHGIVKAVKKDFSSITLQETR